MTERQRKHGDTEKRRQREEEWERLARLEIENQEIQEEFRRFRKETQARFSVTNAPKQTGDDALAAVSPDDGMKSDVVQLLHGMQSAVEGLRTALATNTPRPAQCPAGRTNERTQATEILKRKLQPLNTKAADMTQELDAFFHPTDSYFEASGLTSLTDPMEEKDQILFRRTPWEQSATQK